MCDHSWQDDHDPDNHGPWAGRPAPFRPCCLPRPLGLNKIARDDELSRRRFAVGLERRGGTLALSWANISEFGNVLDEEQARPAERFIDANLPRAFCIEVNPFTVIEQGQRLVPSPESDDALLRVLAGLKPEPLNLITARGLLTAVTGHLQESHERLSAIFMERHTTLSGEYEVDEKFRRLIKNTPKSAALLSVLREILGAFLVDRT